MNHSAFSGPRRARQQQGSIIVFAAIAMSVIVITLSLADIGFLYYYKREYQKAADLAAMAGARRLPQGCAAAVQSATENVERNIGGLPHNAPTVETGSWTRQADPRFSAGCAEGTNAVRVRVTGTPPRFLLRLTGGAGARLLVAEGLATSGDPVAVFSVGTRLADLGSQSVVGGVLSAVGIKPGLDLMSYNGLAGVMITPAGLLEALGIPLTADLDVADFNALLAAEEISLGQLLDAVATLAGQDQLLGLNAQLLQALRIPLDVPSINDIVLQLGSDPHTKGLFAAITSPADAALNVGLDALGLVSTAIAVATSGRGIGVDVGSLGGLGPLLGADLTVKVGVVEPPSIGIGGVGTTAYSAQTRVYAHIKLDSNDLLGGVGNLLGGLLGTSVNIDLPLVIDVAGAKGTVDELCTPSLKSENAPPMCPGGEDCADIGVDAQIAKICVGNVDPNTIFSTAESCDVGLGNKRLLDVNLLGTGLIGLNSKLAVDALATDGSVVLAADQIGTVDGHLDLGTTIGNVTDALLAALLGQSLNDTGGLSLTDRNKLINDTARELWGHDPYPCSDGYSGRSCRVQHLTDVRQEIEQTVSGLQGFLGGLVGDVLGLVGNLVTLDVLGLLGNVGGLVGGVLGLVGDILGSLLGNVLGLDACTGWLVPGNNGACVEHVKDTLRGTVGSGGSARPAAVVVLVGSLLEVLRPVLDAIGTNLLMPLLQNLLGLQVGQTDVNLMALECREGAVLVD